MCDLEDDKEKFSKITNAKELLEAIKPFLNEVDRSPAPGESTYLDNIRYMARQVAVRLYEENELLPEPPATERLTDIKTWCIKANRVIREEKNNAGTKISPLAALKNPVSCVDVSVVIRKRSDNIATKLINHNYKVIKIGRKNYCDAEDAAVLWPKWKKHWQEHTNTI